VSQLPRLRPVAWVRLAAFVASIVVAVIYLANERPRHAVAFFGLAVVAAVGLWLTSAPPGRHRQLELRRSLMLCSAGYVVPCWRSCSPDGSSLPAVNDIASVPEVMARQ
jgi:hypothetical protein